MKITGCEVFQYDIPLLQSLSMMGHVLSMRSGMIILVHDDKGNSGVGEVAPFPGLHKENLTTARNYLFRYLARMSGSTFPENIKHLEGFLNQWFKRQTLPSVRFGIEEALLLLLSCEKRVPLYRFLFKNYNDIIRINGLLTGPVAEMIKEAKQYKTEGYQTLKLKVGHRSVDEDIKIVESVRGAIGDKIDLRLDANRSWSLEDAICFGKAVSKYNIEYIEEPTKNFEELSGFYLETGIPIALDESLSTWARTGLDWPQGTRAVVLKPSLIGGIFRTRELASLAKKSKIAPIISCAFLSGFSLALLTQLSAGLGYSGDTMGLDTYKWFQYDILKKPFCVKQGQVNIHVADQIMRDLRFDVLVKLS